MGSLLMFSFMLGMTIVIAFIVVSFIVLVPYFIWYSFYCYNHRIKYESFRGFKKEYKNAFRLYSQLLCLKKPTI